MVERSEDRICRYYLSRFERKNRPAGPRSVGMEAKFCLTDMLGGAVSREKITAFFDHLTSLGWEVMSDPLLGLATGAVKNSSTCIASIATGTGHCKIEFSVPYGRDLEQLERNLESMLEDAKSCSGAGDINLLCLGVHPVTEPSPSLVQKTRRHMFWDRVFPSRLVHLFALTSDCQVHVDIDAREVHEAVNALQGLCGAQIALTANAGIWKGLADDEYVDVREAFWDWWLEDEDRAGIASEPFDSIEDYVDRISSMRPVFVSRGGESLGIFKYESFKEYFSCGTATAVTAEGEQRRVRPEDEDIDLHDTFNWFSSRLSHYCTVENRANCQQPPGELMSVPALTLGIVENLEEAGQLVSEYDWGTLRLLRKAAIRSGPEAEVDGVRALDLAGEMLDISRRGLLERGLGEEKYLKPLEIRLDKGSCPAFEARRVFENEGIEAMVERYSL